MERFVQIYNYIAIVVGCRNYIYDTQRHRYRLDHKPTIVYTAVLNVVYVFCVPYSAHQLAENFHSCILANLLSYINQITAAVNIFCFVNTTVLIWLRRALFCQIGNNMLRLTAIFTEKAQYSEVLRSVVRSCYLKIIVVAMLRVWSFAQAIYWILNTTNQGCDEEESITIKNGFYIAIFLLSLMLAREYLVEFNLYVSLINGNMLLTGWHLELSEIADEVRQLSTSERFMSRIPSWHAIHWLQLRTHCERVLCYQRETMDNAWKYVANQQFHLLGNLYKVLLETIAASFDLVLALSAGQRRIPFLVGTIAVLFTNVVFFFRECEEIRLNVMKTNQIIFILHQELSQNTLRVCESRSELSRLMEMTALEMQHRNDGLKLMGFFDLNMATAFGMIKAVVLNCLLLIQFAFKDFKIEMYKKEMLAH